MSMQGSDQREPVDFLQILNELPRASSTVAATAAFRSRADDFEVEELLKFEPSGQGDHLCLWLEKTTLSTYEVIDRLVTALKVKPVDIGYFGLKDKHAISRQWFSVHLPGSPAAAKSPELGSGLRVLAQSRHNRKFRIGSHRGNRFRIVLREFDGDVDLFARQLETVYQQGFPNYFAAQRFGHNANNLVRALYMFHLARGSAAHSRKRRKPGPGKRQRALYLSSARAFLFNLNLGQRVGNGSWLQPLNDEKLLLAGSHSVFDFDPDPAAAAELQDRLARHDIHTSGVLWGTGEGIAERERVNAGEYREMMLGLESAGLKAGHRALRATVSNGALEWQNENVAILSFELPVGSYATSLLREVCLLSNLASG